MTAPFTHKPLERPSFFLRLLGRQPKINGLIEMNNLLAQAEGVENVSMQQVDEIATRYRIRMLKDLKDERRGLCGDFLRYCIEDHRLDTGEADRLQHLRRLLRLSEEDVARVGHIDAEFERLANVLLGRSCGNPALITYPQRSLFFLFSSMARASSRS